MPNNVTFEPMDDIIHAKFKACVEAKGLTQKKVLNESMMRFILKYPCKTKSTSRDGSGTKKGGPKA